MCPIGEPVIQDDSGYVVTDQFAVTLTDGLLVINEAEKKPEPDPEKEPEQPQTKEPEDTPTQPQNPEESSEQQETSAEEENGEPENSPGGAVQNVIVSVQVNWDDNNNASGTRPASMAVTLLADGRAVDSVTLSEANNWYASVNCDRNNADTGEEIEYRWVAGNINGYVQISNVTSGNSTVITNTLIRQPEPAPEQSDITVNYRYLDGTEAAAPVTQTLNSGEEYSIASPVIDGFTASQASVTGTKQTYNEVITVIYAADQLPAGTDTQVITAEGAAPADTGTFAAQAGNTIINIEGPARTPLGIGNIVFSLGGTSLE